MSDWSLQEVFNAIHNDVVHQLQSARSAMNHPGDKGDASEQVWIDLLNAYLPRRYQTARAHVVDSTGASSDQIDVVIFDRHYSPFLFTFKDKLFVPAESVYAVFEAKQAIKGQESYAANKVASVRRLQRTSNPVPTVDGTKPPKQLHHILGGFLCLEAGYAPPLGSTLLAALMALTGEQQLDIGCIAADGTFDRTATVALERSPAAVAKFLLMLASRLQDIGTVPMLDIKAYARNLPTLADEAQGLDTA